MINGILKNYSNNLDITINKKVEIINSLIQYNMTKIKTLVSSIRFWLVTLTAVVAVLQGYVDNNVFIIADILVVIEVWLGAVVGIGTLDSIATKFGISMRGKK